MMPERIVALLFEINRYTLTSLLALTLDGGSYTLMLRNGLSPLWAGSFGYLLGLLLHYALSCVWVFRNRRNDASHAARFGVFLYSGLMGLCVTATTIQAAVTVGNLSPLFAKGIAVPLSFVLVYAARRSAPAWR
jgi:putative flippase GtrA